MNTERQTPLERLRYHVTGAIERGEKEAIVEQTYDSPEQDERIAALEYDLRLANSARESLRATIEGLREQGRKAFADERDNEAKLLAIQSDLVSALRELDANLENHQDSALGRYQRQTIRAALAKV